MIDYVKMYLINIDAEKLLNSSVLDFKSEISKTSGAINEDVFIAKYHLCEITIKKNNKEDNTNGLLINPHVIFTGSIHKMWNEFNRVKAPHCKDEQVYKGFNGNQFTIHGIIEVRKHLENLFDCNSNQMIFQNIEFGVNTTPKFNPSLYLKGLLYHKNIPFEFNHSGNYAQAKHQFFIIKIYNKSYQYKMSYSVLRVELKITKMEELKGFGINTFSDINENTLSKAKSLLLKRFDEVMHYDYTIQKNKLSKNKLLKIKDYSNPRYWIQDLKPIHRDRHKKSLREITLNCSDNIHQQIRENIVKKCVMNNRLSKSSKCVIINHSNIQANTTQKQTNKKTETILKINEVKKEYCKVTGLGILMQKDNSILLSHTGLKYYFKNNKEIFEQIKTRYLSKVWRDSNFEIQIKEIAHNIRNTNSNQNIKQERIYKPQQFNMFSYFDL